MTNSQVTDTDATDAGTLVRELRSLDIVLAVEGERLLVNAPKSAMTPELRARLAALKAPVMALLRRETTAPLSFAQQRLWLLGQLDHDGAAYHIGGALRLIGPIDPALFERVLTEIVRRHAALRTTFDFDGAFPVQVIHPPTEIRVEIVDVPTNTAEGPEAALAALLSAERLRAFDLTKGPLFRSVMFRLSETEHVLALSMHHIVADAWSLGILASDFVTLYSAYRGGLASPLPEPAFQYADHARWQHLHLQGSAFDEQLAYWKTQLGGGLPTVDLPSDRPRPALRGSEARLERFELAQGLLAQLHEFAVESNATLFMVLLAAFKVLVHRYTGLSDVVVGTPIANRTRLDSEGLIGFFANTLVLRTALQSADSFRDVVQRVRSMTLDAYAHQDVPFEKLVEVLQPARDLSRTPLFQIIFALQNVPATTFSLDGLQVSMVEIDRVESKADLVFLLHPTDHGCGATIEFSAELFDASTIRRMWHHYEALLHAAMREPQQRVGALPMLDAAEAHHLVVELNDTATGGDDTRTLHGLVTATVQRVPNAPAVTDHRGTLSYAELDQRATALARRLRRAGIHGGSRVAVCLDRSAAMVVSMLGILKAGAAYVPLDPTHPPDRLRHILADAEVGCAIIQAEFAEIFDGTNVPLVLPDDDADASEPAANPEPGTRGDAAAHDLAYLIYTSGSTGRPKGVEVEHRNVVSFLDAMRVEPGMTSDDTLLAITTLAFDIAGLELWLPLVVGARVVIASREDVQDATRLSALLEAHAVTMLQATPATWRALLDAQWPGKSDLKALVGGEAVPRDLADAVAARVASLWNMYGPTETTVWSTFGRVVRDQTGPVSIGRPIRNTRVYVLEPSGHPAPIGVVGELCIAGAGVARGYRRLPELTTERFATVSLPTVGPERVYRTGDLACWREPGTLEFVGRRDEQIKLRGYRIELGEIESTLLALPAIRQAAAVIRTAGPDDVRLATFVVLEPGFSLTVSEIRLQLRKTLPDYMVPAAIVELDALPLTPNGKVARQALPNPFVGAARPAVTGEPPAPGLEQVIAGIWCSVLGVTAVSAHDNFFEIGGHSLLSLRVVAQLRDRLGWQLDPREMFFKSLRQLAGSAPADIGVLASADRT